MITITFGRNPREQTGDKTMKIKDLDGRKSLGGQRFKHPETGETCYWVSQWGYETGKAGVWYRKDPLSHAVFPIYLNNLKEALEFEVVE